MARLFHISDTHLSFTGQDNNIFKDMTKFGPHWDNWWNQLFADWDKVVNDEDHVLIGGDIAWPHRAFEPSLRKLAERPGHIYFIDGNHDKWIDAKIGQIGIDDFVRHMYARFNMRYIGDQFIKIGNTGVLGKKLCDLPTQTFYPRFKQGFYDNARFHLENLVDKHEAEMSTCANRIFLSHYPLVDDKMDFNGSEWLKHILRIKPTHCLYGHYHGEEVKNFLPAAEVIWRGIKFINTSLDLNKFKMRLVIDNVDQEQPFIKNT